MGAGWHADCVQLQHSDTRLSGAHDACTAQHDREPDGEGIANLVPRSVLRNALLFVLLGAMFLVPGISGAKPLTWRRSRPLSSPKARAARAAEQQHARQGGPSCALM